MIICVSNAALRRRRTKSTASPSSKILFVCFYSLNGCLGAGTLLCMYVDCRLSYRPFYGRWFLSCCATTGSMTLVENGVFKTGIESRKMFVSSPVFFNRGVTYARFSLSGKIPVETDAFIRSVMIGSTIGKMELFFKSAVGMASSEQVLLAHLLLTLSISFRVWTFKVWRGCMVIGIKLNQTMSVPLNFVVKEVYKIVEKGLITGTRW